MLDIYQRPRPQTAIWTLPDGRQVCNLQTAEGGRIYKRRTYEMEVRQGFRCAICERTSGSSMEFDHQDGRGMNGSNRDDRIEDENGWLNAALCHDCNTTKGSKRYRWIGGKYVPKLKEVA